MSLDLPPEAIALIVVSGLVAVVALACICSGAGEELDAGLAAVLPEPVRESNAEPEPEDEDESGDEFELSDGEVNARFYAIVVQLRAEADQRNCGAHDRDVREAEHFDTLPEVDGGNPR